MSPAEADGALHVLGSLTQVDASNVCDLEAFVAVYHAAENAGRPYAVPYRAEELRAKFVDQRGSDHMTGYLGRDSDGGPVAVAMLTESLTDNLDKAGLSVWVAPDRRGRGFGSAMAEHVIAEARRHGRTVLMSTVNHPSDEADDQGSTFARRLGFAPSHSDVHRVLDLPVDDALLDRLVDDAAGHHREYTFLDLVDAEMPESVLPSYLALVNALLTDSPTGTVEFEAGGLDGEQWRANQETMAAMGRTAYRSVALGADGRAAAHSVLVVSRHDPGRVFQWDTLVHRDHRGRRLGIAVKARNLRAVQRAHPQPAVVHTWNAASNSWMIAVNEALGFRPVEVQEEWVRALG